jgi:capsular exopolysaccharide synthesis family protein
MDESGGRMLRQYLEVIRRRWIVIVLIVVVTSASAYVVSLRMTPIYQADTQINVTPFTSASSQSNILNMLTDPTAALQTDVTLIQSDAVLGPAAKAVGLASPAPLASAISAKVLAGTQIIEVSAVSPVPAHARNWANAVSAAFINFQRDQAIAQVTAASQDIAQRLASLKSQMAAAGSSQASATVMSGLSSQIDTLQGELDSLPGAPSIVAGGGVVVAQASLPTIPVSPKKSRNVLLGAMVGLLLAVGLVLLIEALDDRLRSAEEVEARAGVPTLGSVPYTKELSKPSRSAAIVHEPTSAVAEAYRTLRTNLRFLSVERPLRTLLVTSSVKGEGKSTTSANLAAAFAVSGVRTVLVSADLRHPSVHRFFGLENSAGVVDAILPDVPLDALLQTNELPDLWLLAAGRIPPNPTEILASSRFAEVLQTLSSAAELVIVDSPPLLGVADASALASRVDGVLLVVNPGEVNRRTLEHATKQLNKAGGRLLGTVTNAVGPGMSYGYGYGYDYDYCYAEEKVNRKARKHREKTGRETKHKRPKDPVQETDMSADVRPVADWLPAASCSTATEGRECTPLSTDRGADRKAAPGAIQSNANGSNGSGRSYPQATAVESPPASES